VLSGADCVVPVPLHPIRRVRRGFNQAADIARQLSLPVANALWRTRPTRPQTGLSAASRHSNVRDVFTLSPWSPPVTGRIVVLVDDVRTTGATLNACAKVLSRAGAREVRVLTIAVADPPGGPDRRR
jgi:ComF family protein